MAHSRPTIICETCRYSWTPRGRSYSLRCPNCGARMQGSKHNSNYFVGCGCLIVGAVGMLFCAMFLFSHVSGPDAVRHTPSATNLPQPSTSTDAGASPEPLPQQSNPASEMQNQPVDQSSASDGSQTSIANVKSTKAKAESELKMAKSLFIREGHDDAARKRLRAIVEKYPGTEAAAEAEKLLRRMDN